MIQNRRRRTTRHYDQNRAIFCASGAIGYNNHVHDNIDHGYIRIDYLDIDIHAIVYSNISATTPVNNVRVVTRPRHSRCDCGREERRNITDAVDDDGEEERRMRQPSKTVAIVRFSPATTEGEC